MTRVLVLLLLACSGCELSSREVLAADRECADLAARLFDGPYVTLQCVDSIWSRRCRYLHEGRYVELRCWTDSASVARATRIDGAGDE